MNRRLMTIMLLPAMIPALVAGAEPPADMKSASRKLASLLAGRGDHEAAAIEYRRLALMTDVDRDVAGYYWAAAHQYGKLGRPALVEKMLDRSEDRSGEFLTAVLLVRAESALAERQYREAGFYLETVLEEETGDVAAFAARRLARARVLQDDLDGAREALRAVPGDTSTPLAAIDEYADGSDRIPWVGGVLGIIPGLGYLYSGEYSNAARSFLLNGIFITAMTYSAREDQWGAFAGLAFFELTWYTGSIYGGIDAAHRYNRERVERCLYVVDGTVSFTPVEARLPIVSLSFDF